VSDFDALEWPTMAHGAGTVETEGKRRLNVRDNPIAGKVLGSLAYGEHVVVWSALKNGWYLVQADGSGLTGYVLSECIRLDAALVRSVGEAAAKVASKLGWHCQMIPGWANQVMNSQKVKLIDPPAENPLPGRDIIGRVYIADHETNAMAAQGAVGARIWWDRVAPIVLTRPYVWAWCLPNEPGPLSDWNFCNQLADFTIAAANILHSHGKLVIGGELPEGNPGGSTDAERSNLFCAVARGLADCDYWSQHAYWMPDGYPHKEAGYDEWHALRYRMNRRYAQARGIELPPVLLDEAGWDFTIGGESHVGWRGKFPWGTYFADLKRFDADIMADSDVLAASIFVSGAGLDWLMFEIGEQESRELATYIGAAPVVVPPVIPPEVPPMSNYPIEVVDGQGGIHDLAWLQKNYGALIAVHQVPAPCYRLKRIIIKETGDVNLDVWVHNKDGQPEMGTPVTYSFPASGADDPLVRSSVDLPAIPAAFLSRWAETGVLNKNATGGDGHVSFQIGSQSWINSSTGGGPYAVWVLSNRLPSDCINRIGWRVLTNHFGPTTFLFEEVTADVVVPPTGDLPENEPVMTIGLLADKVRWWMEKYTRCIEVGNAEYAPDYGKAILYSLIKLNGGLLYRLENALKAGKPTG
jgi:hypothetical protein